MIRTTRAWLASALLACGSAAFGAEPAAVAAPTQAAAAVPHLAHSALLTIDATSTDDSLNLVIRRVRDRSPVNSDAVTVTVDGKSTSFTRGSDGTYQLPISDLRGDGTREIDVIVAHDGIREVLSGKLSLPDEVTAGSVFRDHKQVAWWILNIVIVLIAAIAISRRKG
jgi:hypothetical protein